MRKLVEYSEQFLNQFIADGVALFRTAQRDSCDGRVVRKTECFVVHISLPPLKLSIARQSPRWPAITHREASAMARLHREQPTPLTPARSEYFLLMHPVRMDIHPNRPMQNQIAGSRRHTQRLFSPRHGQAGYADAHRSRDSRTSKS